VVRRQVLTTSANVERWAQQLNTSEQRIGHALHQPSPARLRDHWAAVSVTSHPPSAPGM